VKIICTRYRNQVQCFQIISYDLLLCKQNCTNGWELDDHRFQSKLVIIPFYFQPLPPNGRSDEQHPAKYSFVRFRTLLSLYCIFTRSSIDVSRAKIIGILLGDTGNQRCCNTLRGELTIVKALVKLSKLDLGSSKDQTSVFLHSFEMSIFRKWYYLKEEYLARNIELSDIKMAWLYSDIILTQIGISDIKGPSLESWVISK